MVSGEREIGIETGVIRCESLEAVMASMKFTDIALFSALLALCVACADDSVPQPLG